MRHSNVGYYDAQMCYKQITWSACGEEFDGAGGERKVKGNNELKLELPGMANGLENEWGETA